MVQQISLKESVLFHDLLGLSSTTFRPKFFNNLKTCLLYTSDAADEEDSVDLGGRRIIKKKFIKTLLWKRLI